MWHKGYAPHCLLSIQFTLQPLGLADSLPQRFVGLLRPLGGGKYIQVLAVVWLLSLSQQQLAYWEPNENVWLWNCTVCFELREQTVPNYYEGWSVCVGGWRNGRADNERYRRGVELQCSYIFTMNKAWFHGPKHSEGANWFIDFSCLWLWQTGY